MGKTAQKKSTALAKENALRHSRSDTFLGAGVKLANENASNARVLYVPPGQDSKKWGEAAKRLHRPALERLVSALHQRLAREQEWRKEGQGRLQRTGSEVLATERSSYTGGISQYSEWTIDSDDQHQAWPHQKFVGWSLRPRN